MRPPALPKELDCERPAAGDPGFEVPIGVADLCDLIGNGRQDPPPLEDPRVRPIASADITWSTAPTPWQAT